MGLKIQMRTLARLLVFLSGAVAGAGGFDYMDNRAVRDSLTRVHPRARSHWLAERGYKDSRPLPPNQGLDSVGIHCIGRWSYGPSYDVDGRASPTDTLVALARGSGVSLIRFRRTDSVELELLADINAEGLMHRVRVRDTLLYVGSAAGLEIWDIADEQNTSRLSWTPLPLNDFCVQDSLAYIIGADDSFKVYNVAEAANPVFLGACRDSGDVISVCNGYAYVGDRWGLYVVDARDPASPQRIASWGTDVISVAARNAICCVTTGNPSQPAELNFSVLDVTRPDSLRRIGYLGNAGGYDVSLADSLAFLSGYYTGGHELRIVSLADSTQPVIRGIGPTPGWNDGVWASAVGRAAFVADDWEGLQVFDVTSSTSPEHDTCLLGAHSAVDIALDGTRAYVANNMAGLWILDLADPTRPQSLGNYDSIWQLPMMGSAVARDSFAYVGWGRPRFRTVDVTNPTEPASAGDCYISNPPADMVLRDSFVYCAEAVRFQIVNVARPREPVLVGSCEAGDANSAGLCLQDTLAFVGNFVSQVINVADPASPVVIGTFNRGAWNVAPRDTFAFVSSGGVIVYSVADPAQPLALDSISLGPNTYWVEVVGNLLYTGNRDGVHVVDASDVHNMHEVGFCATPYSVKRLHYSSPYIYAACWDAGVCIFESTQVAVYDAAIKAGLKGVGLTATPNPAAGRVRLTWSGPSGWAAMLTVHDVLGKEVVRLKGAAVTGGNASLDVTSLASGVYYAKVAGLGRHETVKFVKR